MRRPENSDQSRRCGRGCSTLTCLLPKVVPQEASSRFGKSLELVDVSPPACVKNLVRLDGLGVGKAIMTSGQPGGGGVAAVALFVELILQVHLYNAPSPLLPSRRLIGFLTDRTADLRISKFGRCSLTWMCRLLWSVLIRRRGPVPRGWRERLL